MTQLPGIAGEIEEAIGFERAVVLLRARGGTEISIPKKAEGSALAAIIGDGATEQLIDAFGAGKLVLPCAAQRGQGRADAERREAARELLKAGQSLQQVALACDVTVRTASRYRAELEREQFDMRQGKLNL